MVGFFLFALCYYFPLIIDTSGFTWHDQRIRTILSLALSLPSVQIELLRNLIAHLLLLALCYFGICWVSARFARITGLNRTIVNFALLIGTWLLLVSANGLFFPLSNYSFAFDAVVRFEVLAAVVLVVGGAALVALLDFIRSKRWVVSVIFAIFIGASLPVISWGGFARANSQSSRNIVIIGVDSLSNQVAHAMQGNLPNLGVLLTHSIRFERAYTPLGRTFPAWVTLLSGEAPAVHGAIFNLRNLDAVQTDLLVTRKLGQRGYRRIFAQDERRFSNIDESFGFDQVIGPKIGSLDFILQTINDTPLTNLLLQARWARYLLPFSYLNVASVPSYNAAAFIDETLNASVGGRPLFLAVHLESAHFPFKSRNVEIEFDEPNQFLSRHKGALTGVDWQVGRLISGLREQGRLDDALVIVLSDHGESLGEPEGSTTRGGEPIIVRGYGHGGSLLSEHQNRIVLSLVKFRDGVPTGLSSMRKDQVSLLDVRETIENYADTGEVSLKPRSACILVETGFRLSAISSYRGLDAREVINEGINAYELNKLGRIQLTGDAVREQVEGKDVGLRCLDRLTYYSASDGKFYSYRILDDGMRLMEMDARPDDIARIENYRLKLRETVSSVGDGVIH